MRLGARAFAFVSMVVVQEGSLTIGTVDAIQKLHIQAAPLHEQPRRVAYQEETHTLGVLAINNLVGVAIGGRWLCCASSSRHTCTGRRSLAVQNAGMGSRTHA